MRLRILILITGIWVASGSSAHSTSLDDDWRVNRIQAECLIGNIDRYLDSGKEPLIIVIAACPETDPKVALQKLEVNSATPQIKEGKDTEIDQVVIFTREELACLRKVKLDGVEPVVQLPKLPCAK